MAVPGSNSARRGRAFRVGCDTPTRNAYYGSDQASILDREAAQAAVFDALRELPDSQRRTLLLHDLEGNDPGEIAIVLSVTEDRVREDLEGARRTLRRRLREYA